MQVRKPLPLFQDLEAISDSMDGKLYKFKNSDLGRLYQGIPWDIIDKYEYYLNKKNKKGIGRTPLLSFRGEFALMILKHYTRLPDEKLMERFNTDFSFQFFCNVKLSDYQMVKDKTMPSRIRKKFAQEGVLDQLQKLIFKQMVPYMDTKDVLLMDATCYESNIRYPTDVKLLWESVEWLFNTIKKSCKSLEIKQPRSKFNEISKAYLVYSRKRKRSVKETKKLLKRLLYISKKGVKMLQKILDKNPDLCLKTADYQLIKTIRTVNEQQDYMVSNNTHIVKNRIVSLPKPYVRPIVRGKENKPVEFGQKAHILMIDGISFIEYMSFNAYNECKNLKHSYLIHKLLTEQACKALSADKIYATNENRSFLTKKEVLSGFVNKGRKQDDEDIKCLKSSINIERSTRLEGRFGHQKVAYGLDNVRAKTAENERVWVFFGVMCSNAVELGRRISRNQDVRIANSKAA